MAHISVVGAGAVGTAVANQLADKGHDVTVVSREMPGQLDLRSGVTTRWAAGIGCIFKPSSELVAKLVLASYEDWMTLARNGDVKYISETDLKIVVPADEEVSYAGQVEGFHRIDDTTAQYTTYSLNPELMLEVRIAEARKKGVQFVTRPLTASEIEGLRDGVPLAGSDYTVEATGLAARDYRPELNLYPIAGVLVHFIDPDTQELRDSYMYENKARYVVTRPSPHGREIIVGGTFLEGVGTMGEEERFVVGRSIVEEAQAEFAPLGLNVSRLRNPREVSVGFRPGRRGDPVIEIGEKVAVVTGLGGQGIVTNPALAKHVVGRVLDIVPRPKLITGWDG